MPYIEFEGTVQEWLDVTITETMMRLSGRACNFVCNYVETFLTIPDHWIT